MICYHRKSLTGSRVDKLSRLVLTFDWPLKCASLKAGIRGQYSEFSEFRLIKIYNEVKTQI